MSAIKARRVGLIGQKLGMSSLFDVDGSAIPVTLVRIENNTVLQVKKRVDDSYSVLLGVGKSRNITKPLRGIAKKAGIDSFAFSREFVVLDSQCILKIGDVLSVEHLKKGQFVDVTSISIGKGFAGGIKRHGFSGLEASHGVSISHRALGSTGQRQDPGKVFKGKKMAGHMGCERVTVQNLRVVDVDTELGIVAVLGAVPGGTNKNYVLIRDAKKKIFV